eukprot:TRINITY_DN9869_c0_g1_i1.p1 TRINITY_DN9869_c0_g1~~TRINITY_DN9869_c0_g1_i1.p1  ORF type:complete len:299 (+),score=67.18 TRINITY_DN9869_c0_g1_i1:102-998(+)
MDDSQDDYARLAEGQGSFDEFDLPTPNGSSFATETVAGIQPASQLGLNNVVDVLKQAVPDSSIKPAQRERPSKLSKTEQEAAAVGIRTERVTIASHDGGPITAVATSDATNTLTFDPEDMLVEDLRQECRLRNLATSGPKNVLIKRLRSAVTQDASLPTHRMTDGNKRRKRLMNKREPQRDEFATEEEYQEQWQKWREVRDHNNESVKRSRENARFRKAQHEKQVQQRERENSELATEVSQLREQVAFLTKVLKDPEQLSSAEQQAMKDLVKPLGDPPTRQELTQMLASLQSQGDDQS